MSARTLSSEEYSALLNAETLEDFLALRTSIVSQSSQTNLNNAIIVRTLSNAEIDQYIVNGKCNKT